MASIICKYFVQNDEADFDPNEPNLFVLSQKYASDKSVKLKDIIADFPLSAEGQGNYHLRFQTSLEGSASSPIWVDIMNEEAVVPLIGPGVISIKALRLPHGIKQKIKKPKPLSGAPEEKKIPPKVSKSDVVDFFNPSPPEKKEVTSTAYPKGKANEELFDIKEPPQTRPRLDSDSKKAVFEFDFGSEDKKIETGKVSEGAVPKRAPPKLKPLGERIIEATNQIHTQWKKEEKDNKAREEAYVLYEEKIRSWIGTSGSKNNIRTLLCTVHTVLWPGCEWKALSMSDLISGGGVKRHYTLAIKMCHPDKVQGLEDQHIRYIADRVFNALNDAYNEFRKSET